MRRSKLAPCRPRHYRGRSHERVDSSGQISGDGGGIRFVRVFAFGSMFVVGHREFISSLALCSDRRTESEPEFDRTVSSGKQYFKNYSVINYI